MKRHKLRQKRRAKLGAAVEKSKVAGGVGQSYGSDPLSAPP